MDSDRGAMAELYARYVPAGVRLAYLLTGDRHQAEDLAQEAFIRCVGRFSHLRSHAAFESYLRRAIVNLHTSGLRR
ncbi:MAG: sigma factor, partial [Actinomycetota bacterium]